MSRPRPFTVGQFGVVAWSFEVATWGTLPGRAAHSPSKRATSRPCAQQGPRPGHCARSVHATWFLGVRTMHTTQFCDNALFRVTVLILFVDTVHEQCSQGKKKYKIFKKFSCV